MIQTKRCLAKIEHVYAIAAAVFNGRSYCLAASEDRNGSCVLIDIECGKVIRSFETSGGIMALIPIEEENAFLSIEGFYPVFDSAAAKIYRTKLDFSGDTITAEKQCLCDLPYVHRIGLYSSKGEKYLMAATLCSRKDYIEDWSFPGSVYAAAYRDGKLSPLKEILSSLTKNHGMYLDGAKDDSKLYIGSAEGIHTLEYDETWKIRKLEVGETSDVWLEDFDDDGTKELAVIQGFHGNHLRLLKEKGTAFEQLGELPLSFGHVLWAGRFKNQIYVIGGSRSDERELVLYRVTPAAPLHFERIPLDKGTGPAQISVTILEDHMKIYAANHYQGTVDEYIFD